MFYLEIIFKTIFGILSIHNIVTSLIFFIFCYLIFISWKNIREINSRYRFLIVSFRFLILLLIMPIFENQNFTIKKK